MARTHIAMAKQAVEARARGGATVGRRGHRAGRLAPARKERSRLRRAMYQVAAGQAGPCATAGAGD